MYDAELTNLTTSYLLELVIFFPIWKVNLPIAAAFQTLKMTNTRLLKFLS